MSVPYSNVGRTVNINKVKGLNFDKFHNDEMCKRTSDATMGRTNIRANETANNNILSLNVGSVKCGNINAELNELSEKRLHINCNNVLTNGLTITQDGNVGIGITTPTAKLHIGGTITAGATTVDSLITSGTITAGGTTVDSLITSGAATVGSLTTSGAVRAGATIVDSLVTAPVVGGYGFGTIHGGFTTLTGLMVNGEVEVEHISVSGGATVDELVTDSITGQGTTINVKKKLNVTDTLIVDAEFRCQNGDGTITHFNNGNGNKNYIRGTDTYCDTHFRMDTKKYILFGNLQAWFLQSGIIWFNLLYSYTNNGSQQVQNELNFGFNTPNYGSWSKLFTITGDKIHYRRPLQNSSDDRLKHNETDIVKGLNIIRQLQPQKYQKTVEMYEADYNGVIDEPAVWEAGLIAQKILQIPELTDYVAGGDEISESGETTANAYSLDYNSISMYGLAAIKELDTIVQSQQSKIDSLEARLAALENNN